MFFKKENRNINHQMNEKKSSKHDIVKKVNSQSKKHHFEESGCEEEFNSLFP